MKTVRRRLFSRGSTSRSPDRPLFRHFNTLNKIFLGAPYIGAILNAGVTAFLIGVKQSNTHSSTSYRTIHTSIYSYCLLISIFIILSVLDRDKPVEQISSQPSLTSKGAIIDLDGTVYRDGQLLPGVSGSIDTLREAGVNLLFFSNNPSRNGDKYVTYLSELGLDVRAGEALSAGTLTTQYLQRYHSDDEIVVIGQEGLHDQIRTGGLQLTDTPERADVLVASWTTEFNFETMTKALTAMEYATTFIGTNPDRTHPLADGQVVPGSGAIIDAIAAIGDREPDMILGKPSEMALEHALDLLDVPPRDCFVIGDRLDTDLAMGERAGMTTVLVLTGVTDRKDIAESDIEPDYVIETFGDIDEVLVELI